MSPQFANAVDPIYLYVLGVLDRITANETPDPGDVRERVKNRFREAEAQLGQKQGWELAKYALVAWIDDVFIEAPWNGREWWENNSLEFEYFKSRDRAIEFFKRASEAAELTRRDALEVFYVCVVLGFRGLYGLNDSAFLAEQLSLPADVESWAKRTARSIQLGQGRPTIGQQIRQGEGAWPLYGKYELLRQGLIAIMLAVAVLLVAYYVLVPPTSGP